MRQIFFALALFAISNNANSQIYGTPVVYYDFENGIPDGFQNTCSSGISQWEYRGPATIPDISVASRGSCGPGSIPIASQTASNGFVIFDSNYWDDDDDVCGDLATGQDPAPHDASFITEPINLEGYTSAVLTWQQSFKDYQATLTAEVSNDGGNNWTIVYTNNGSFTAASEWQTVNITALAAGYTDVRIRFHFTGTYYWWQLDDIAVYTPNPNDIMIQGARYTTYNGLPDLLDMQYDSYPSIMIPPFKFAASSVNIGANLQNDVKLTTRVFRNGTQIFAQGSGIFDQPPGNTHVFSIGGTWAPSSIVDNYTVTFNVDQVEADNNTSDNNDTLDYRITQFTYARDERIINDFFNPAFAYSNEIMEVGNVMQSRAAGLQFHSIGVAISDQSIPGTSIYGKVYLMTNDTVSGNVNTLIATTSNHIISSSDLCAVGEEKITSLELTIPVTTVNNAMYLVMVGYDAAEGGLFRVGRSGETPAYSSLVSYPESNALFYLLSAPVVRMHIFPAGSNPGCTDPLADNYDADATVDDGTCHFLGCTDELACNYDPTSNYDDFSCFYSGCTDPLACNFSPSSGCEDGSCTFPGCNDPSACNYDPAAGCNDGSCISFGCTDPLACNYNSGNGCEDGSCAYPGCANPSACNYDPTAGCDNGTCVFYGCTDPASCNYNSGAGCDDGSCIPGGCNDPAASNFDPLAQCNDGSCEYCNGDFNEDGIVNIQDLLLFTSSFGCLGDCGVADINNDGAVNVQDLLLFSSNFGSICGE